VLRTLAERLLHDLGSAEPEGAWLIGVPDGPPVGGPAASHQHAVLSPLPEADPPSGLLGLEAPPHWWAVGLLAPATTSPLTGEGPTVAGRLVHLLARDGCEMTLHVADAGRVEQLACASEGRVVDLCRRALGLATAPPPPDVTPYVVDVWLGTVVRAALVRPGLSWSEVVRLHPALDPADPGDDTAPPRPAEMVAHTRQLGAALDWEKLRRTSIEHDRTPLGELSACDALWMDAGCFARWLRGESPRWADTMEILDGLLAPTASDRLWATLSLARGDGGITVPPPADG
jgi:hypothetical protein